MNNCKKKKIRLVNIFKKKNMDDNTIMKIILMNICKEKNMDDHTIKKIIFVNISIFVRKRIWMMILSRK